MHLSLHRPRLTLPALLLLPLAAFGLVPLLAVMGLLGLAWCMAQACATVMWPVLQAWTALLPWQHVRRLLLALVMGLGSAWLLSACGTAPSQGQTCPPVPAALLKPPQQPVLLQPASP